MRAAAATVVATVAEKAAVERAAQRRNLGGGAPTQRACQPLPQHGGGRHVVRRICGGSSGTGTCLRRRVGGERKSECSASAAATTWCFVMAAATAGEMRGECCANVSSGGAQESGCAPLLGPAHLDAPYRSSNAAQLSCVYVPELVRHRSEHCRTQSRRRHNCPLGCPLGCPTGRYSTIVLLRLSRGCYKGIDSIDIDTARPSGKI